MGTRLWAISSSLDQKIIDEQKCEEALQLKEAYDYISELRAYELIDNGLASEAGEY